MKTVAEDIVRRSMLLILERFEAEDGAYPFVNTKFDIVSGRDFGEGDEEFRQRGCIYSWIQGRGLESIARHAVYFRGLGENAMALRLEKMLAAVAAKMEELRAASDGRLPFAMRLDGSSFFKQEPSAANFSDLFYSKGLFAAGRVLDDVELMARGRALFLQVLDAVWHGGFHTDQQSFDPKNQVAFVPGKFPQGPMMIALGGIADFIAAEPGEELWCDYADRFIRHILRYHVNTGAYPELQFLDFIESIDAENKAWRDGKVIFSDPGHALEFIGLASRCLVELRKQRRNEELVSDAGVLLPKLFCHVFDYGFNRRAGGISKGFDLVGRRPVNDDMPWWSLPECVRAGMELMELYPKCDACGIAARVGCAFQAFTQGFLQDNGFACQTRSADGKIVNVIPAVSDADPGYHTNLSLLCLL